MRPALRTLDIEIAGLEALRSALEGDLGERLEEAVRLAISLGGRIHVTGIGKSGHVGRKLAATLTSTGSPAHFLHAAEASHGDLGTLLPDARDLLVVLSWSGDTPELIPVTDYARVAGIPVVAMTGDSRSLLGTAATIVLELPRATEACPDNLAPTTSTTMQLALGDAFALALLEARGLASGDRSAAFRALHPGGKLGARLTTAQALMHRGAKIPLVRVGASVAEAIVEMTGKGFGVTGVLSASGGLIGIVTDGDLRRGFARADEQGSLMKKPVESIMTARPWTIAGDALAPDILSHMNATKITSAFVVDAAGSAPLGIVHLHDLLRIGLS
jgi:arabinose-5-phosphate isomerase